MMQSKFILDFWFVSYNIFCYEKTVRPTLSLPFPAVSCMHVAEAAASSKYTG
jgi:hypothetical protein